jgi:transcription elongation factor Elf1
MIACARCGRSLLSRAELARELWELISLINQMTGGALEDGPVRDLADLARLIECSLCGERCEAEVVPLKEPAH